MAEEDEGPDDWAVGPPLPPDDRLWRHPSELEWPPAPAPALVAPEAARPARPWGVALSAGLAGAALAIGAAALLGALGGGVRERVVERVPVRDLAGPQPARPGGGSGGVTAVADAVSPSVVRVEVAVEGGTAVSGSGVVFRDDGTVLTNAHVVDGARAVRLVLADGTPVPATVVGADASTDVAVLAADPEHRAAVEWVPAVLGTAEDLRVGQQAIAIGAPLGLPGAPSVTAGVVSGLHRRVAAGGVVLHDMIQTDAAIASGSSGGALADGRGVVVGITTALGAAGSDSDGLSFATPIDVARAVALDLLGDGDLDRPWLGIEGADAPGGGVQVLDVVPGGPAHDAGLAAGDVVTAVDGEAVRSMSALVVVLRERRPGDRVVVVVDRAGRSTPVPVVLGSRP